MIAPERIWAFSADDIAENEGGATIVAHESYQPYATEYVRADLAAVQPMQVHPDPRDELIARLMEALEFYAPRQVDGITFTGNDDAGVRARAALAAAKAVQHG